MPYQDHPLFEMPKGDHKLWKYMDLAKFLSLLTTSELYFTRIDHFEDPYEGFYSNPSLGFKIESTDEDGNITFIDDDLVVAYNGMREHVTNSRVLFYVSCWHLNPVESAAMWKLYSMNEYGMAIKTSFPRLIKSIEDTSYTVHIGKVSYLDYDSEKVPIGNAFYAPLYKRSSFEYEHEVRAVIWSGEEGNYEFMHAANAKLSVNLNELIEEIFIAPTAPKWIVDVVNEICQKYNINAVAKQSDLMRLKY